MKCFISIFSGRVKKCLGEECSAWDRDRNDCLVSTDMVMRQKRIILEQQSLDVARTALEIQMQELGYVDDEGENTN